MWWSLGKSALRIGVREAILIASSTLSVSFVGAGMGFSFEYRKIYLTRGDMNVALLVDFNFAIHVQEGKPRLSLDASTRLSAGFELVADCPSVARHLTVVLRAADGFARFVIGANFVGFEVKDSPIIVRCGREGQ
jgi:hypothetical protein